MSGSFVQVIAHNSGNPVTTQTTAAISTTSHNALAFFAVYKSVSAGVVTPSDSTGLTWQLEGTYTGGASGLTLAIWIANNITGNAANTFTFASTGADTPSIFIVEAAGCDLFAPFDFFITASDTVSASGAHTTGTINARGGDLLLAFNVSSSTFQTYTATGLWAIPPGGAVQNTAGYDSFIQYVNGANGGPNANTYSVASADKLDALIVSLKPPALPYSDEYFEDEVPDVYSVTTSYQQTDLPPQLYDQDIDWIEDGNDSDSWIGVEDQSAPVGASVAPNSTAQYYGEDMELLDEALDQTQFSLGYQQADFFPSLGGSSLDDPWDWFQEIDDDEWTFRDESNVQNPNVVDNTSVVFDAIVIDDQDDDQDDFFADDFGNDDADLPQNDVWDHFTTDDDDYVVTDDYINITNPGPLPIGVEDAWDHFTTDDDDWSYADDYANPPNPLLNLEDGWSTSFDDSPDLEDEYWWIENETDYRLVDNNPVITLEDPYDHWPTEDDDYVVIDDYAIVDVVPNTAITVEDPFDQFVTDDDDYFIVDEFAFVTLVIAVSQPPEDSFDQFITDDDDWIIPDDYAIVDVAVFAQVPVEDGWTEHWVTDDDDYVVIDDYASVNNTPISAEDSWDHFTTDPDDETWQQLDTDQIQTNENCPEDPWDHWITDPDDELYLSLDPNAVEPFVALNTPTDGWNHFETDDDDWAIPDDYALITAVVAPSQFTDEAWDWFYEPAEDNDQDFAVESAPLAQSLYIVNPNFEVYIPQRDWVVLWLPANMDI